MTKLERIAAGSIAVAVGVLALKVYAWRVTGSAALYSDAAESIINVAAALVAFFALKISARPPDANHPFGHQKAEFFSAIIEGVLIVLAALAILRESYLTLLNPRMLSNMAEGLSVNAVAMVINAAWAVALIRWGRRYRSPALGADGRHLMADVVTSLGVIAGLIVARLADWPILDPLLAALVALNVLYFGLQIVRGSVGGLMDEMVDPASMERIAAIVRQSSAGAIEAHDLKARSLGRGLSVEFHLVVPGSMPVGQAHEICDRIEKALEPEVHEGTVLIHVEPDHKAKHEGAVVVFGD